MTEARSRIAATGAYCPSDVLTSDLIESRIGLEPGWIERRTGIRARRIARPEEALSDLAVGAAEVALGAAPDIDRSEISLLVLATSTPDHLLPPTAPSVAHRLGLSAPAFDLAASCSGFVYGLALADRWLRAAPSAPSSVLLIGANLLSRRVRWTDPRTASLFADGAGAVIVRSDRDGAGGIRGVEILADGSASDQIHIPSGGSRRPLTPDAVERGEHLMVMNDGPGLFRNAVRGMTDAARAAMQTAGVRPADIDWYLPHQASVRIVERTAELLGIPRERVIRNVECYGNTSAATIPIALHEAVSAGRIRAGDLVLLAAAGAGLTAGAAVLEWGGGSR